MPQREFFAQRHAVRWDATYTTDPLEVGGVASIIFMVRDQAHEVMETCYVTLPTNVAEEAVPDLLRTAWEAYIYGELGSMARCISPVVKGWREEADRRSR